MRPAAPGIPAEVGYSTGALAQADFRRGLRLAREAGLRAIEISALRLEEFAPLVEAFPSLDLAGFHYVSVHAPSSYPAAQEPAIVELARRLPAVSAVVVHPDAIVDAGLWRPLGPRLTLENMDARKPAGRTARELEAVFRRLPEAGFCFDIAHAWHVDPSMREARCMVDALYPRLRQVHASGLNSSAEHTAVSPEALRAYAPVAALLSDPVPWIIESPVAEGAIPREIEAFRALWPRA